MPPLRRTIPLKLQPTASAGLPDLSERQLFECVYQRMRALAGAGAPDLDDLVQVAAEQVFRNLPTFAGRSELKTWVYAVCYRVLLNQRRWYRRWAARFAIGFAEEVASGEPSACALLEEREQVTRLRQALLGLSDKYRAVVVLHDFEELAIDEVAQIVRANPLTVRSRLRDGRKQLKHLLEVHGESLERQQQ